MNTPFLGVAVTDLWTFAKLLSDVAPSIELIDGRVFLDRNGVGPDALRVEMAKHRDAKVEQQWMNSVPMDGVIDCVVDDGSIDDPLVQEIAKVYVASWTASVEAKYGMGKDIALEVLKDSDSGDVIVRLNQS